VKGRTLATSLSIGAEADRQSSHAGLPIELLPVARFIIALFPSSILLYLDYTFDYVGEYKLDEQPSVLLNEEIGEEVAR
jgi:hypothetical protein